MKWYEMSQRIEQLMHEKKGMFPNVDFYSASTYYLMGIPLDLYHADLCRQPQFRAGPATSSSSTPTTN